MTLLGISLLCGISGYKHPSMRQKVLHVCAALSLGCLLLATIGGFGDFFNTFVAPDIRCYNRIVPFLSFFAIVAVAVMMQTVKERWWAWSRTGFTALVIAIVAFAAVDQPVTTDYLLHDARAQLFHSDAEFVHLISRDCLLELQFSSCRTHEFPVEQLRERMFNNDHGRTVSSRFK